MANLVASACTSSPLLLSASLSLSLFSFSVSHPLPFTASLIHICTLALLFSPLPPLTPSDEGERNRRREEEGAVDEGKEREEEEKKEEEEEEVVVERVGSG